MKNQSIKSCASTVQVKLFTSWYQETKHRWCWYHTLMIHCWSSKRCKHQVLLKRGRILQACKRFLVLIKRNPQAPTGAFTKGCWRWPLMKLRGAGAQMPSIGRVGRHGRTSLLPAVNKNAEGQVAVHIKHENKGWFKQNYLKNIAISNSVSSSIKNRIERCRASRPTEGKKTPTELKFNRNRVLFFYALADWYNCWQRRNTLGMFQASKTILKKCIQKASLEHTPIAS